MLPKLEFKELRPAVLLKVPKPEFPNRALERSKVTEAKCIESGGKVIYTPYSCFVPPPPAPPVPDTTPTLNVAPTASVSVSGDITGIIKRWAAHYSVDSGWLLRVAVCESGLNPGSINRGYSAGGGNPSGIFQFLPQTFYANAARAGVAGPNLWNVEHQAQTAAYMFSIGQHVQWACK